MKNMDDQNASLDLFLRRLMIAPRFKRDAAIRAAMAILDGSRQVPPEKRIFYNGREAARMLNVSYQTLWRLRNAGTIKAVYIKGMDWPRYARADLERLVTSDPGCMAKTSV